MRWKRNEVSLSSPDDVRILLPRSDKKLDVLLLLLSLLSTILLLLIFILLFFFILLLYFYK